VTKVRQKLDIIPHVVLCRFLRPSDVIDQVIARISDFSNKNKSFMFMGDNSPVLICASKLIDVLPVLDAMASNLLLQRIGTS